MSEQVTGQAAVTKLIDDAGLTDGWATLTRDQAADLQSKFESTLADIAANAAPEEHGTAKIVVGGWSFRIGGTLWPLVVFIVKLGIATHDPTGLSWKDAISGALDLLSSLASVVHKLDPTSQLICAAIAKTGADHRAIKIAPAGASRQEIMDAFAANGQQPPVTLDDTLKRLGDQGVIVRDDHPTRGALYSIAF